MKKIGFYGGCFNPPTNAHIELAQKAIEQNKLNKLFFVPVGNQYSKNNLVDARQRVDMLNLAIKNYPQMQVLEIELNQEKNLKANEVFRMIQYEFNNTENFFIMGADNFVNIEKWENAKELIQNFKYIILARDEINLQDCIQQSDLLKQNSENFDILNAKIDISSTFVRNLIEKNQYEELKKYLNIDVVKYITDNDLYNPIVQL